MNFGGQSLLGRSTIASGRALLVLSIAVLLTKKMDVSYANAEFLGISLNESQIDEGLIWVISFLIVSHVANWVGDFLSLGRFNSSLSEKKNGKYWSDIGDAVSHLETILKNFKQSDEKPDYDYIYKELKALESSRWWHEKYSVFYVLIWTFLIPITLAGMSIYSILHA